MTGALILLLVALASATPPFPREVNVLPQADGDYRLPGNILPLRYNIKLVPYLEPTFTFDGEVLISVQALEATSTIVLHADRLTIDDTMIVVKELLTNQEVIVTKAAWEELTHFYTLTLAAPLRVGTQYTIHFKHFTGVLDSDMAGFYRSSYVENGITRWLATTQFESTSARRAFPCFDEPALKAMMTLSISRPENMRAIANMPQNGQPFEDTVHTDVKRYWDQFDESPAMSTYLIAFIVSDFVFLENAAANFRVYAQPNMISQARYSLDVSPLILDWLAEFLDIPFHLPKMDEAAIPDFDAGAMENWGLVTYRERLILFQEGVSTSSSRQSIATVIAHEYAHQWFGDYVSPLWWKWTWLNEGFATYFEFFGTGQVEPSWRLEHQFITSMVHSALSTDASQNSHPMSAEVASPSSISAIFDGISYAKSGSVIRMMEHIVSPAIFQRGLKRYLVSRAYKAAQADDLFASMNEQLHEDNPDAGDVDVKKVMDTWSTQMGYPVVTVTRDYAAKTAQLTQERFIMKVIPDHPDTAVYKWHIPLTYTTQAAPDFEATAPKDWFYADEDTKTVSGLPADNQWVLFNVAQSGFYRVNYDAANWALLAAHLNTASYEDVHVLNRAQLLDDSFNLAEAGVVPYSIPLAVSAYLTRETDYVPWVAAFARFTPLDRKLVNTADYDTFKDFLVKLMSELYTSVGFDEAADDGHVTKLNRGAAVKWACQLGVASCVTQAKENYAEWIATPTVNPTKPDQRSAVYCTALKTGGKPEWDFMWQQYTTTTVATDVTLTLSAPGMLH